MFKKTQKSLENPALRSFLNAQSERLDNRYDTNGQPVVSTLGETVSDQPDPVTFLNSVNDLPIEDGKRFFADHVKGLMGILYHDFNEARAKDSYYDPLDDETFIDHASFDVMSDAEKKTAYTYLSNYLAYLEREARGKHVQYRPVGRHAVSSAQMAHQASASTSVHRPS